MNQLNQMQKEYLKKIMELNADYTDFNSLSFDSIVALNVMNDSAYGDEWKKPVNSFMQSWLLLQQMKSKIVKVR